MSTEREIQKPLIAWVDHERRFFEQVLTQIQSLCRTSTDMASLDELIDFVPVLVDDEKECESNAVNAVRHECYRTPDLILVDLLWGEHPAAVHKGRKIARRLRAEFQDVPVGVYTRHALPLVNRATVSSDGFSITLEDIRAMCESHAQRLSGDEWWNLFDNVIHTSGGETQGTRIEAVTTGRKVFIGHGRSKLWKDLKDFIQDRLKLDWDEFNREPSAGTATKERLEEMLTNACFAFLVMTGEDVRADGKAHARENVIHEIGLFQGKLGFRKAIVLVEDGCEEFSNITGLTQIRFLKDNIEAVFEEIRRVLEREWIITKP